ncbi:MAG TPA: TetR/AcrR family transcriptional regulator [Acidimicrobiales bacterium]|nr:TetR/AcrR family transcriptional regulator [Acidimicrobiales bacterium]
MATRRYEQRLRAEHAEETRRRILDAVAQRLREAPTEPVSLDKVARLARVARSTIYLVFGSRAGLFDAFADDLWQRTGLPALSEAVTHPDARQHLRGGLAAACKMYAADRDIYRVLHSMAQLDPESVGGAAGKMDASRKGGMEHLARRLAEDGVLRADVSVEYATDVLWMLCSFDAFDLLYAGRGLPLDDTVEILVTIAERSLCRA